MNVLAIDSATPRSSVAIASERGPLAAAAFVAPRGRHEAILPAIQEICGWSGIGLDQLGGIAVGTGPGLFTGLRVGVGVAKSLAQVLHLPIIGASSLDVLAFAARATRRQIAACIDARRGEVFFARYRPVPGGVQRVSEPAVLGPDGVLAELVATGEETLLIGNGAMLYRDRFDQPGLALAPEAQAFPDAAILAELTIPRFLREEHDDLYEVVPQYLRRSDAEIALDGVAS